MAISDERKRRRASFDEHAALYDSVRPSYPDEVFDDVAELAELAADARIVEIGCGTGQGTGPPPGRGDRSTRRQRGAGTGSPASSWAPSSPGSHVATSPPSPPWRS